MQAAARDRWQAALVEASDETLEMIEEMGARSNAELERIIWS